MSWFARTLDRVTPWERRGEARRRREREEEERRRQQQQQRSQSRQSSSSLRVGTARPQQRITQPQQQQQRPEPEPKKTENIFESLNKNLGLDRPRPNNVLNVLKDEASQPAEQPAPGEVIRPNLRVASSRDDREISVPRGRQRTDKEELFRLTEENMDDAREQASQGRNWWQRNISGRDAIERDAGVIARNRATRQFQDEHGWNQNPNVREFSEGTSRIAGRNVQHAQDRADDFNKRTTKIQQAAAYVPIIGAIQDWALRGGAAADNQSAMDQRIRVNYGMEPEEYQDLQETAEWVSSDQGQQEMQNVRRMIDENLSAFDFLGSEEKAVVNEIANFKQQNPAEFEARMATLSDEERAAIEEGLELHSMPRFSDLSKEEQEDLKELLALEELPDVVRKMGNLENLGTAAGLLDFVGAGALIRAGTRAGGRAALRRVLQEEGVRGVVSRGARTGTRRVLPTAAVGTGLMTGAQAYVGGAEGVDPGQAAKSGLLMGAMSLLYPGRAASQATRQQGAPDVPTTPPRNIPVRQGIDVRRVPSETNVTVRNLNEPQPLIREVGGDATISTPDGLAKQRMLDARYDQAWRQNRDAQGGTLIEDVTTRPSQRFELDDATVSRNQNQIIDDYAAMLRDMGQGHGVVITPDGRRISQNIRAPHLKGKNMTKKAWREEASRQLKAGKADPAFQQAFREAADPNVQSLMARGETTNVPEGRPIRVQEERAIPVRDETTVPQGLPETPGQVRATTATAPTRAKTEIAAAETPVRIPRETQEVLDNPSRFTKRQVAAARNQRKLARQYAKVQEETAEAMSRVEAAQGTPVNRGTAPTGELGRSTAKASKGRVYEKTSFEASRERGEQAAATTSYEDFMRNVNQKRSDGNVPDSLDVDTARALQNRFPRGSKEFRELGRVVGESVTDSAQRLRMANQTVRKSANADQITNNFVNRFYAKAGDTAQLSDADFARLDTANNNFTNTREAYNTALNQALDNPTQANVNNFMAAMRDAADADRASRFVEYDIAANRASKSPDARKFVRKMEQEAGVYTMDWVDSSMLSSTRVMINNYFNTLGVRLEEQAFGKAGARIGSKLASIMHKTDVNIGGANRTGRKLGRKIGTQFVIRDARLRQQAQGNALTKGIKNIVTTGNTAGERNIQDAVYGAAYDHYRQGLRRAGYTGKELENRTLIQTLADPDKLTSAQNPNGYMHQMLVNNSLASAIFGRKYIKFETSVTNRIEDAISPTVGKTVGRNLAKLTMRVALGFPTVVFRAGVGGTKRAMLGTPTVGQAVLNAMRKGDPQRTAMLFKESVKQFGSGGTMMSLGAVLAANGIITGGYPTDKDERARWQREGIRQYSIKIGSNYWDLPAALGVFAIPMFTGAKIGENIRDGKPVTEDFVKNAIFTAIDSMPLNSFTNLPEIATKWQQGRSVDKEVASIGASAVRGVTPLGSLVNQLAKAFDGTANETTQGDLLAQLTARIMDGVPGLANTLPAREVEGREIENPGPVARMLGAVSKEQSGGVQKTDEIRQMLDESVQSMQEYGVFNDNIREILDDEKQSWFDKAQAGEELNETQMRQLTSDIVRGITSTSDTHFLEREDYDSNLAVLKLKRDERAADPTTTQRTLDQYNDQITRGEIYKEHQVPYELISMYNTSGPNSVGVEEWRKMGIPPGERGHDPDIYDPELYEQLWQLDQIMTEAGVSRGKRGRPKYSLNESTGSGSGRGGRRALGMSGDFGRLKAGQFAPSVQQYQTIDQQAGSVPVIRRERPNIVHKISSSG